jgi:hypothetical protein
VPGCPVALILEWTELTLLKSLELDIQLRLAYIPPSISCILDAYIVVGAQGEQTNLQWGNDAAFFEDWIPWSKKTKIQYLANIKYLQK